MKTNNEKKRTLFTGKVISDKMQKTVTVEVEHKLVHPKFRKVVRVCKKYAVHDENELAKTGDMVTFYEGRPVSKRKYMYLFEVVKGDKSYTTLTNQGG